MGLFKKIFDSFGSDVTWYCDGCNSVLNDQEGFNTYSGTWECTECGHINDVTDNNVYSSEEEYQESMGIPRCPYCGGMVHGDAPDATYWFNCNDCGTRFYLENGELKDPFDRSNYNSGRTCINCGQSLDGGTYVGKWEEGNSNAYVLCPHCNCPNYDYSDDD